MFESLALTFVCVVFMCYRAEKQRQLKKLIDRVVAADVNAANANKNFCNIIASQHAYIKELEGFSQLSKAKIDEIAASFIPVTDAEHAGVIMFQKLDAAIKAAEKIDPDSQIAKELKALLK